MYGLVDFIGSHISPLLFVKDDSIILEEDIIDEHIDVVSNLEEHDNGNDGIEAEIDQDDGFQSVEDDSNAIDLEAVESEKNIE